MDFPVLAFMGEISFFFYLSHGCFIFTLMTYTGIFSAIYWITISFLLFKTYNFISQRNQK